AKERARTFEESFRFPLPTGPVEVTLEKRNRSNAFVPLWTFKVDPKDQTVSDAVPDSPGPLIPLLKSGPSESKVDLLILGDGYTRAQRGKFEKDAKRLVSILFSQSPFKERKQDFNVWASAPSRVSRASPGPPPAFTGGAGSARPTTRSAASATSSPSTTAPFATWPRSRPTSSWRSWSTGTPTGAEASSASTAPSPP